MKRTIITVLLAIVTLAGWTQETKVREASTILQSYWRDDKGDWKIAFLEDCAIYDCKIWTYKQRDVNPKTGEAKIVMTNGGDELKVTVGKNKKGTRTMQIGNQKMTCEMITGRFLADYPTKDTRTSFVDTGYKTDTVTLAGWIKDMPEEFKGKKAIEIEYTNFLTDDNDVAYADLDEQGRFLVKIPVINSTEFHLDWNHCFGLTMLEAGKTYFLFYDFKEDRRMFMGEDTRLQNELLLYPSDYRAITLYDGAQGAGQGTPELIDQYIGSVDRLLKATGASIDSLCQAHPTLSTRYCLYRKGNMLWHQASAFCQSRFKMPGFMFPDNAHQYAYDTFWTRLEEPVTLYRTTRTFLRDFIDDLNRKRKKTFRYNLQDHFDDLTSDTEELALLNRWKDWIDECDALIKAAPTPEEKQKIAEKANAENADMISAVDKILEGKDGKKASRLINGKLLIDRIRDGYWILDSLQAVPIIKDAYLSQMVYEYIDGIHVSLLPEVIDTLKALNTTSLGIERVEKLNANYHAIENREFDKLVLKSSEGLAGLSDGEALLKKIVEPFRGKFVLLDIWGTWCGPCKEALSHSTEEYARLNGFDIEYLYLANRSPQESYENVIKEYNVSGPNVAHYNLPEQQQAAIERHLNVHAWPAYKLFDRDGNLLDLNVDPQNLDDLVELLERMK